jgi:hypothetical protein
MYTNSKYCNIKPAMNLRKILKTVEINSVYSFKNKDDPKVSMTLENCFLVCDSKLYRAKRLFIYGFAHDNVKIREFEIDPLTFTETRSTNWGANSESVKYLAIFNTVAYAHAYGLRQIDIDIENQNKIRKFFPVAGLVYVQLKCLRKVSILNNLFSNISRFLHCKAITIVVNNYGIIMKDEDIQNIKSIPERVPIVLKIESDEI